MVDDENAGGYYVIGMGKDAPSYVHRTLLEAHEEAKRLAKKHPKCVFEIVRRAFVVSATISVHTKVSLYGEKKWNS